MWASIMCCKLPFKILAYLTYFSKKKEKQIIFWYGASGPCSCTIIRSESERAAVTVDGYSTRWSLLHDQPLLRAILSSPVTVSHHEDARFCSCKSVQREKEDISCNSGELQYLVMTARVTLNVLQSLALVTDQRTRLALWTELGGESLGINNHLTVMMRVSSIHTLIQNAVAVSLVALCFSQTQNRPEIALEWSLLFIDIFLCLSDKEIDSTPVLDVHYYHAHFLCLTLIYVTWYVHNVVSLSNWLFTNRQTHNWLSLIMPRVCA